MNRTDELNANQFLGVHMKFVPVVEDLLTLEFLLFDTDMMARSVIAELGRRSVQKFGTTVRLFRYNTHICYVSQINTVCQSFR